MKLFKLTKVIAIVFACAVFSSSHLSASAITNDYGQINTIVQTRTIDAQIIKTSARQDGENVIVEGLVRRQKEGKIPLPNGCVDITVLDQQGKIVDKIFTKTLSSGTYNGGYFETPFITQIPMIAPLGSLVSIKFHNSPHHG